MIPTTEPAKRIGALFRRRITTHWSEKEVRAYKKLVKLGCFDSLDDLELIERYYAFERRKGDSGLHRRDLFTFVGNYCGELDRANEWSEKHPKVRKIIPLPTFAVTSEQPLLEEDPATVERFKAEFAQRFGRPLRS